MVWSEGQTHKQDQMVSNDRYNAITGDFGHSVVEG